MAHGPHPRTGGWLRFRSWSALAVLTAFALHSGAQAQQASWWVVGASGDPWAAAAERWIALDDAARPGALQPTEVPADQNLLRERVSTSTVLPRNMFGYRWSIHRGRLGMDVDTLLIGWHSRLWLGGAAEAYGIPALVDGDELANALTTTSTETWVTLDLGVPLALDSLAFFPPQYGVTSAGLRTRDIFPPAYEVSRTDRPVGWLLFDDEAIATGSTRYHPLDDIVASTFSNNQSVVGLKFPLRFTRFVRLKFGGVPGTGNVAEIKAYGRGYAAEGRLLSKVHAFPQPVSFGRLTWKFTKYRTYDSGEVLEDPNAPVTLTVRTRSGIDDDPTAYFVFDELGRTVEVTRDTFFASQPVRWASDDGLPRFRSNRSDDVTNWNVWSVPYQQSGDEIRSSDGRRYFQFRVEIGTEDPMAFGVLDSLAFQVSPLLADSVLAEVSLAGQPSPPSQRVEVPMGVDTVFVYDLRTAFRGAARPGFDAVELDVPQGTRLLDLEIDGVPAVEGQDFALLAPVEGKLGLAFARRIAKTTAFRMRFRAAVFQPSTLFGGRVFDRDPATTALPQSIEPGDARLDVGSDQLQVVATEERLQVLGGVSLAPAAFTPNGDGRNDSTAAAFAVYGVEQATVRAEVYDLAGRRVAVLMNERVGSGHYRPGWHGRDAQGKLVPPGVYLVRVEVDVDQGTFVRVRQVAVAY